MKRCGFATAKGYGTARSVATVWYVGSPTSAAVLLPGDARATSVHVRSVLANEKKEIPYNGASKGHRVHNGYTVLSPNPKSEGVGINSSNTSS